MSTSPHELIRRSMLLSPVIPVLVIERTEDALPLAQALLKGGLKVLEVTLRTPNALKVIQTLVKALPDAVVAAGTITTPAQWEDAARAGAHFGVSPGLSPAMLEAAPGMALPLLPGVATASELMTALDAGFESFKFFPAHQAGGIGMLKAFGGPFAHAVFCPTGGITLETAPSYLALPNVACVGGSWLTPSDVLKAGNWPAIENLARQAAGLRSAV